MKPILFFWKEGATRVLGAIGVLLLSLAPLQAQTYREGSEAEANARDGQYCGWETFRERISVLEAFERDPSLDREKACWVFDPDLFEIRLGVSGGLLSGTYEDPDRSTALSGSRLGAFAQAHLDRVIFEFGFRQSALQDSEGLVSYQAQALEFGLGGKWPLTESWELQVLLTLSGYPEGATLQAPGMSAKGDFTLLGLEVPVYWRQGGWFAGGRLAYGSGGTGSSSQTHRVRETMALNFEGGMRF